MDFFKILRNILQKTNDSLEEVPGFLGVFSSYMLIRYLSMRDSLLPYAQIIQDFQRAGIDELTIYKWAYKNIPYQGNCFIKYITKPKTLKKDGK